MKHQLHRGVTSKTVKLFLQDSSSTVGAGLTGLTNASAGLTAYYIREGDATATAITLAAGTVGTWSSGGFKEVDATNMPGIYELGLPNAAVSTGNSVVVTLRGATNLAPRNMEIQLTDTDVNDAVRFGLTALPNAAANATAGLAAPVAHGGTAQAGAGTTITLAAGASATTDLYKGMVADLVGGTGAPQCRTITAYNGSTKVATVDRAWATNPDATSVYAVRCADEPSLDASLQVAANAVNGNVTGSVGSVTGAVGSVTGAVGSVTASVTVGTNNDKTGYSLSSLESWVLQSGTAQAGAATTITLAAGASATNTLYVGQVVKLYGGTGAGQARVITAYAGSTKVATIDRAWQTNPDATTTYAVLSLDLAATDATLQVAANAVNGNVTGSVGSVTGAVGSVTGNVGGNVVGSVASVTAAVDILQSAADKVWASTTRTLTAFSTALAQSVWDVLTSAVTVASSMGLLVKTDLDATISSRLPTSSYTAPPTAQAVSTQVWSEPVPGSFGAGTGGNILGNRVDVAVSTRAAIADYTTARAAKLDNLDALVSSRLATAGYTVPPTAAAIAAQIIATALSEIAQGVPSATPSVNDALMALYMDAVNQTTATASTKSVRNRAGTVVYKLPISDDGTTFTKGTAVSGP